MLYLVDNTLDGLGASPRELRAAFEQMRPDVDLLVEPYHQVSLKRVAELAPSHIVLSGQSHPWNLYDADALKGVAEVIRHAEQPILGVCGGHQQIAITFGAPVALVERLEPGEGYTGAKRERGFFEIETDGTGLFAGLASRLTVWHSHYDEVKALPDGFKATASNSSGAIQAMQHCERPLFGVQFHPELFNEQYPDGRRILENFLSIRPLVARFA
jgi:GMP synthase (glutamine-hydrolysing)